MSNRPSKVSTGASMSLDGFIAGPGESGFEHLFAYMGSGEVEVPTAQPAMTLRMAPENAAFFRDLVARTGAIVVGRHLYDFTDGWGGIRHAEKTDDAVGGRAGQFTAFDFRDRVPCGGGGGCQRRANQHGAGR